MPAAVLNKLAGPHSNGSSSAVNGLVSLHVAGVGGTCTHPESVLFCERVYVQGLPRRPGSSRLYTVSMRDVLYTRSRQQHCTCVREYNERCADHKQYTITLHLAYAAGSSAALLSSLSMALDRSLSITHVFSSESNALVIHTMPSAVLHSLCSTWPDPGWCCSQHLD